MKILLFGKTGQLGWELHRSLSPLGEVAAYGLNDLDLSQLDALRGLIRQVKPQIIVNASAYTAVDRAESEPGLAAMVNARAPQVMAEEACALNATLIHYSTDYVFDGRKDSPYSEEDQPNPLNAYGQSKLEGEQAISQAGGAFVILRTSWVYSLRGDGFASKVLKWARSQKTLRIVSDQIGSPTWARMLADMTTLLLGRGSGYLRERAGLYHLAGAGSASRFEWAKAILELDPGKNEQTAKEILPALSADFPTPAARPLFSALDCSKFEAVFGLRPPEWRESLRAALCEDEFAA